VRGLEGVTKPPEGSLDPGPEGSRGGDRRRGPFGRSIAIKTFIKGRIDSVTKQLAGEEKGETFESRRRRSRPDRRRSRPGD